MWVWGVSPHMQKPHAKAAHLPPPCEQHNLAGREVPPAGKAPPAPACAKGAPTLYWRYTAPARKEETIMEHHGGIPYLTEAIVFLLATVAIVPLFHRLRASPVLGYLFVGALIGPYGLRIVSHGEGVRVLAELGVVFLLFAIGLELSPTRLRAMRRILFGLGGMQVVISAAILAGIAYLWNFRHDIPLPVAVVAGTALAFSSTAVVVQLLVERKEFAQPVGRMSFAILLLQDLAVVPFLVLIGVLGGGGEAPLMSALGVSMLKAVLAIGAILLVGYAAMRFLFPFVADTHNAELLTALALLAILGAARITESAGLSMGLGAFLVGVLLSESEFRHQVASDTFSFRGLFLGMFFISIGMSIDFLSLRSLWLPVFLGVVGLIVVKGVILYALCRLFRAPPPVAVRSALLLATGGEFALVAVSASAHVGLFSDSLAQLVFAIALLSMILTPLLAQLGDTLAAHLERAALDAHPTKHLAAAEEHVANHVILAGYGRIGRAVGRLLRERNVPFVALDTDIARVRECAAAGEPIYYGDASRIEILRQVGIERAALVLVTIDNPQVNLRAIAAIARHRPNLPVQARAHDSEHGAEQLALGASHVVLDTVETSISLAGHALREMGAPTESIAMLQDSMRDSQQLRRPESHEAHEGKEPPPAPTPPPPTKNSDPP